MIYLVVEECDYVQMCSFAGCLPVRGFMLKTLHAPRLSRDGVIHHIELMTDVMELSAGLDHTDLSEQ